MREQTTRRNAVLAALLSVGLLTAAWLSWGHPALEGSGAPRAAPVDLKVIGQGAANGPAGAVSKDTQQKQKNAFTISGNVDGLYPGAVKSLVLRITNPNNFAIRVTSLTVQVGSAGPGCAGSNLTPTDFHGSLLVPRQGSASQAVPISMATSAPGACQGRTFPLTFGGEAVKA